MWEREKEKASGRANGKKGREREEKGG